MFFDLHLNYINNYV